MSVKLSLEDVESLRSELEAEISLQKRRMELDARVLARMFTQFGRRNRQTGVGALPKVVSGLAAALRRV